MGSENSEEQHSGGGEGGGRQDLVGVTVVWGRMVVGLVLAATGGIAFGHAWTKEYAPLWWVGGITLVTGILLVLSGRYARSRPAGIPAGATASQPSAQERDGMAPLLGALLVYKFRLITRGQLDKALEEQRKSKRRLGQILVQKGLITEAQLEEALEYQRSHYRERVRR